MPRKALFEIMHNCRTKVYPSGLCVVQVAAGQVFREKGWELADQWEAGEPGESESAPGDPAENLARAKRRARAMVRDYALANTWDFFVTLTLDGDKVDRYDIGEITRRMSTWLDNQVRRRGLRYLLVPELHKDGAVHFHGFFGGCAADAVDSGTVVPPGGGKPRRPRSAAQRAAWLADGGHVVYNLPRWSFGFTTAIALYGDRSRAVGYVCKYITKAQEKVGGRWYYSGGGLALPAIRLSDVDYDAFLAANKVTPWRCAGGFEMVQVEYQPGEAPVVENSVENREVVENAGQVCGDRGGWLRPDSGLSQGAGCAAGDARLLAAGGSHLEDGA